MNGIYRKKPVEVEARQFDHTDRSWKELIMWGHEYGVLIKYNDATIGDPAHLLIHTLEGKMRADIGDWIIKGVANEFYPCKPDIFAATYDKVV